MLPVRIGNREDRLIVEGLLTRHSSRKEEEGEVYKQYQSKMGAIKRMAQATVRFYVKAIADSRFAKSNSLG
jgi:hypothetical protein